MIDPISTFADAMTIVTAMLAAELGCRPGSITDDRVHLVEHPAVRARNPLARPYPRRQPAFAAASAGSGAIVAAGRAILPEVESTFKSAGRDQVFEPQRLAAVAALLRPHHMTVVGPYLRLVSTPETLQDRRPPAGYAVEVEHRPGENRLSSLHPERWPNAISRRQTIATEAIALARHDGHVVGVAGTRADSPRLWQIGIDVDIAHRGRGIGAALTAGLARFILDLGNAAWYGVAPANVASVNTAIAAGFRLAWIEAYAYPATDGAPP
jgi:hypothetical protein